MKQYTQNNLIKIAENNGFRYNRTRGSHAIYSNERGRHMSIPLHLNATIARRLIKENDLKI